MEKIFLITDPNCDPDDLVSYIALSNFMDGKHIELKAVVATLGSRETITKRAMFAKGAFACLGYDDISVAAGNEHPIHDAGHDNFYCPSPVNEKIEKIGYNIHLSPLEVFLRTFEFEKDKSITILVNANMFDLVEFISLKPELFLEKVKKIVIMGAGDVVGHKVVPSIKSYNNAVSYEASQLVFETAQRENIPLILVPKDTVYKVQVGYDFYDSLKNSAHPLAQSLVSSHKSFLEKLWNSVVDGVYKHFTIERFQEVFIGDGEKISDKNSFKEIYPKIKYFNLYDAVAAMAAVEDFWLKYGFFEQAFFDKEVYIAKISDYKGFEKELYEILYKIKEDK